MSFCLKCGAKLDEGTKFCSSCGAPADTKTEVSGKTASENKASDDFSQKVNDFFTKATDTADQTATFDPVDINANKIISLFSYLGFLFIIPYFVATNSKFARFHVNQGFVLFLLECAVSIISLIINWIFFGFLEVIFNIILWFAGVLTVALMIIGIINCINGIAKDLPIIGKIRILK